MATNLGRTAGPPSPPPHLLPGWGQGQGDCLVVGPWAAKPCLAGEEPPGPQTSVTCPLFHPISPTDHKFKDKINNFKTALGEPCTSERGPHVTVGVLWQRLCWFLTVLTILWFWEGKEPSVSLTPQPPSTDPFPKPKCQKSANVLFLSFSNCAIS